MTTNYEDLMNGVMQLPKDVRLLFVHQVMSTVVYDDFPPGPSDEEILRRIEEHRQGRGKMVDPYESAERIRKNLTGNGNTPTR